MKDFNLLKGVGVVFISKKRDGVSEHPNISSTTIVVGLGPLSILVAYRQYFFWNSFVVHTVIESGGFISWKKHIVLFLIEFEYNQMCVVGILKDREDQIEPVTSPVGLSSKYLQRVLNSTVVTSGFHSLKIKLNYIKLQIKNFRFLKDFLDTMTLK